MRIFIVDDSLVIRNMVQKMLTDLGHTHEIAKDGEEAIKKLAQGEKFDITLLDWNMPKKNGMEVLDAISANNYEAGDIIMMTTENASDKIQTALMKGAKEYLMKPFTQDVLKSKLDMVKTSFF